MSDFLFKLRCLFSVNVALIFNPIQHFIIWKEFVWDAELDSLVCCFGRECGCMGVTNREYITWQWLRRTK